MNYEIIEVEQLDGSKVEHIILDNGDGSFTSMTKAHFDELEAAKENGTIS
jgi:DNA/RNA endonuclease YhcR with UshA esterase domain